MLRKVVLILGVVLSLCFITMSCGGSPPREAAAVEITAFEPPEGILQPGSLAAVSARVKNTGAEEWTFFLGYSVQDSTGEWYDAPPSPVELGPGEESDMRELSTEPLETPGYYKSRVSVWSEEPGSNSKAQRLADAEEVSMFRVSSMREDFDSPELDTSQWETSTQNLGRSEVAPGNVAIEDEQLLRLTMPPNTLGGGQIRSRDLFGAGFYAARIRVPDAPSSVTGFFLYEAPDFESEIDIEIYNDSSRQIMFTTYADGEQTNTETMALPFDPTEDLHDYAFFYDQNSITFYVDGVPMKTYEGGLPDREMRIHVNSWFPTWLDGEEPDSERYAYVDWIEH